MDLSAEEHRLLKALADGAPAELPGLAAHLEAKAAAQILATADKPEQMGLLEIQVEEAESWSLTDEGKSYCDRGLPERMAFEAMEGGELPMAKLASIVGGPGVSIAVGWLKRKGWANLDKGTLTATGEAPIGDDERAMAALSAGEGVENVAVLGQLAERGIVTKSVQKTRTLRLTDAGKKWVAEAGEPAPSNSVTQVTPELIARWEQMSNDEKETYTLRPFSFDSDVDAPSAARPHPLSQLMQQTRRIFWQMGFSEIEGDYVESAFWNMDALFIPQDHPAREQQDTFYLAEPKTLDVAPERLAMVEEIHLSGGDTGSTGWGGQFDPDVSKRGLLRTHTTNTTVRYLADSFGDGKNAEGVHRVFGLGRVFRNETMDATHLPEFHQIEGIVTEPNATFDMLVGLCRHFFTSLGFPDVRFRPAYFPYTEPSMEIDVLYRGKWMELGGCGIFRPEVTEPLGVPHPVLAWGFGLERLAMMRLGLKDIRQLYVPDLEWLHNRPSI